MSDETGKDSKFGRAGDGFAVTAFGQTVRFNTTDEGQDKAITEWGVEVVQGSKSYNTARLYKGWLEADGIDVFWSFFWTGAALDSNGDLIQEHKNVADGFIDGGWTDLFPDAAWGFGPNINDRDDYFFPGSTFDSTRWYNLIKQHVEYYESRGQTVVHMMPFNEADFVAGQGSPDDLATIAQLLADDPSLDGIGIMGPSTLSSGNAYNDYTAYGGGGASGPLTHGSTHHLQWFDSASKIADFYTYDVLAHGDTPYNPELHALGEAILSADHMGKGVTGLRSPQRKHDTDELDRNIHANLTAGNSEQGRTRTETPVPRSLQTAE